MLGCSLDHEGAATRALALAQDVALADESPSDGTKRSRDYMSPIRCRKARSAR